MFNRYRERGICLLEYHNLAVFSVNIVVCAALSAACRHKFFAEPTLRSKNFLQASPKSRARDSPHGKGTDCRKSASNNSSVATNGFSTLQRLQKRFRITAPAEQHEGGIKKRVSPGQAGRNARSEILAEARRVLYQ